MASNDTAALVVALSAQVSKFQKDMDQANGIADKAVKKIEDRFASMNGVINNKLRELGTSLSSNLGFAGTLLSTLGPAGIAAAVGIGATVGAIFALASATSDFALKAQKLKEGAETVGLTITQFKLLGQQGVKVGLDFDETTAFFSKFIANMQALRDGGGPLYDALLKIDTGLLRQLSVTKDSAKAIEILIAAFARLDDQTKKLDLAKAAGGRGGLAGARLLESLGGQGGLAGIEANAPAIDEGAIERAARLKREIDAISSKTKDIWGGMFSDAILSNQKGAVQELQDISAWIANIVNKIANLRETLNDIGRAQPVATFDERFGAPLKVTVNKPPPPEAPPPTTGSPSVELAILQKNLALLGEAVTQGEQWKLKRLEIAAAAEKGGLMDGIAGRALAAFNLTMRAAALATRERLGVATEQQIVDVRLAQLAQDKIKFGLKENEVQTATVIIMREAKAAAEALQVRQSRLPELTRELIDAGNATKQFDRIATSSLNSAADAFADVVTGTKSLKDAVHDMTNALIRDLSRAAFKSFFATLLGGGTGGGIFGGIFGGARAGGGPVSSGNVFAVGEKGPELFVPRSAGTIIPNDVLRRGAGGTPQIFITNHVDATGADVATVSRLTAALLQVNRSIEQRAIAAMSMNRMLRA